MNLNAKNNVLTWAVVMLIVANIVVITLFSIDHHQGPPNPEKPAQFLSHELGLDEKQMSQLHELANQHHMESEKLRERVKEARDHFFDLVCRNNFYQQIK